MLREFKTIHQVPIYSTGSKRSLAQILLTLSPPVPFFRYCPKNASITPGSLPQRFLSMPFRPNETLVVVNSFLFYSFGLYKITT